MRWIADRSGHRNGARRLDDADDVNGLLDISGSSPIRNSDEPIQDIIMKPISKITSSAMKEITKGQFVKLPKLSITGLLNDFQYS